MFVSGQIDTLEIMIVMVLTGCYVIYTHEMIIKKIFNIKISLYLTITYYFLKQTKLTEPNTYSSDKYLCRVYPVFFVLVKLSL